VAQLCETEKVRGSKNASMVIFAHRKKEKEKEAKDGSGRRRRETEEERNM